MENVNEQKPEEIKFSEIAEEINAMRDADQKMRKKAIANKGVIESEEDSDMDEKNTGRMKEVVEQIGWPTVSKVGKEASRGAWLLVQHADHDVEFQKHCLNLMKNEPAGEVDPIDIAYLEDRVRVNSKQPQIYGTQFHEVDGVDTPREIENPENVDERRASMGLGTLEEGIKQMREKYKN